MTSTLSTRKTQNLTHYLRPGGLRRPDATDLPLDQPTPPRPAAAATCQPKPSEPVRPSDYRSRRRAPAPLWAKALAYGALAMTAGAVGGGLVLALAVLQAGGSW